MKIGVTAPRVGLTTKALTTARNLLSWLTDTDELHHGDCIGGDYQLATIATELGLITVAHPPVYVQFRAFHESTVILPRRNYHERDRMIVDTVDRMIGCPPGTQPKPHSGTWYTINYAKEKKKPLLLIYPDGQYEVLT